MADSRIPRVLSIAGSDSGGGAGIQADLKAFAACGVHGMTAVTAITAQNTVGVTVVHQLPPEVIEAQVAAVAEDIGIDAVKIGMLGGSETIAAVARALSMLGDEIPVVLDPVMVSESGATLLDPAARESLVRTLFPRATVVTPNLPEARAICAVGPADAGDRVPAPGRADDADGTGRADAVEGPGRADPAEGLVRRLRALGPRVAVVTGGHRAVSSDLFYDGERLIEIAGERHPAGATHGSGCTHSSVLAARLAWGDDPLSAATVARRAAGVAVAGGLRQIGAGAGPVDLLGIGAGPLVVGRRAGSPRSAGATV